MRLRRHRWHSLLLALAVLALTACGDGGGDDGNEAPADEQTEDTDAEDGTDETDAGDETDDADATEGAADETDDAADEAADEGAAAAECGPDHPALHEPGTLTVATGDPVFPPWMMDDDPSNGEGFESAVVYAVAEELGFAEGDVEWVRTSFDEAIAPGEKDYDFNIQQYTATEDREEIVDFSEPYYEVDKALVALPDSPAAGAESLDDLREGVRFGAVIGTTDLDYIEETIGIDDVSVYDDQAGVFQAMEGGQIDATVFGLPGALFVTAVQVEDAEIVGILPGESEDDPLGMLFADGNEFRPCVDEALGSLREDGRLEALADEWLAGGGDIPSISE